MFMLFFQKKKVGSWKKKFLYLFLAIEGLLVLFKLKYILFPYKDRKKDLVFNWGYLALHMHTQAKFLKIYTQPRRFLLIFFEDTIKHFTVRGYTFGLVRTV